jgi:hypothetical protein
MDQHLDSAEEIQKEIDKHPFSKACETSSQHATFVLNSRCLHGMLMPTCIQ